MLSPRLTYDQVRKNKETISNKIYTTNRMLYKYRALHI